VKTAFDSARGPGTVIADADCSESNVRTACRRVKRGCATGRSLLDTWGGPGLTTFMDASELAITARMARLTLSDEEQEKLGAAVEQMLAHFSHMKEIDVQGLVPTTHALLKENRLREDVENRTEVSDTLLSNAPEREERFIVIPNVL
jgi:aspartyl-tRNA(Asn)/glutamyl-tRNA(Gln) amidotransferase subunit C